MIAVFIIFGLIFLFFLAFLLLLLLGKVYGNKRKKQLMEAARGHAMSYEAASEEIAEAMGQFSLVQDMEHRTVRHVLVGKSGPLTTRIFDLFYQGMEGEKKTFPNQTVVWMSEVGSHWPNRVWGEQHGVEDFKVFFANGGKLETKPGEMLYFTPNVRMEPNEVSAYIKRALEWKIAVESVRR